MKKSRKAFSKYTRLCNFWAATYIKLNTAIELKSLTYLDKDGYAASVNDWSVYKTRFPARKKCCIQDFYVWIWVVCLPACLFRNIFFSWIFLNRSMLELIISVSLLFWISYSLRMCSQISPNIVFPIKIPGNLQKIVWTKGHYRNQTK